jgi:integrase/recombinase XerD
LFDQNFLSLADNQRFMSAASIKIILRNRENKDGTRPLVLRIIKNRRSSIIHTGHDILEKDWDAVNQKVKRSHPNSTRLNNFLLQKLAEANNKSIEMETLSDDVSSQAVKQKIKPTGGTTFLTQAEYFLQKLKDSGKYNQYTSDKPRIGHFKDFLKGQNPGFSDITVSMLERFKVYLRKEYPAISGRTLSERSIVNHMVTIRSVFSFAIKNGVTDKRSYPFGADKIAIKFPETNKVGLSIDEVRQLEEVELPEGSFEKHARNLWLVSFYFAGMRVSDVLRLKWSDFQNDRLHYVMGKNNKSGSLKVPEKAWRIIQQYESDKRGAHDFVFPDLKTLETPDDKFLQQRRIAFTVSRVDKFLQIYVAPAASIEKSLTMHIARHTFGNISGDKIPVQMLQKLYRHSNITTTIGYQQNFIHKDADDALDAVVGF